MPSWTGSFLKKKPLEEIHEEIHEGAPEVFPDVISEEANHPFPGGLWDLVMRSNLGVRLPSLKPNRVVVLLATLVTDSIGSWLPLTP